MHIRDDGKVDFSAERPSTDLAKLINLIADLGKEAVLFFPLSPFPFLPHGGIPPLLVKGASISASGLWVTEMDLEYFGGCRWPYQGKTLQCRQEWSDARDPL